MFVPAYFRDHFCPFTRSTSRSESFNSNFKDYVRRKEIIETFMKQYELFQENVVEIENRDRFELTQQIPAFWGNQLIERHAAKIYTRGIYLKFFTELLNSTAFGLTEVERYKEYKVKKLFRYKQPEFWREEFRVRFDRTMMKFECDCNKFERDGIICCHILRIFTQFDITRIPEHYIVERWTSEFREKELLRHKMEIVEIHGNTSTENALRYAMLMNNISDVCSDISRDQNKSKEFLEEVHKLRQRLMVGSGQRNSMNSQSARILKDPPVIRKSSKNVVSSMPETDKVGKGGVVLDHVQNMNQNRQQTDGSADQMFGTSSSLVDPPVSNCASVVKGNRMKPQSEKKANKNKARKK
ncbi:hypothetical protein ACQ4PT_068199 [Festuca glaucescens]